MYLPTRSDPDRLQATRRIKAWTRERFRLGGEEVVAAAQVACPVPGCPPVETIVVFWTGDGTRHRFKVFKPIGEVVYDDLPYAWLLGALVDDDGLGLECC
jgi:nitrate reductase delta subunit